MADTVQSVGNTVRYKRRGFHVHSLPDKTEMICGKMGIMEPITYAMQMGFIHVPEGMIEIVRWAVRKGNIPLMMRLSISVGAFMGDDNEYVNEARNLLRRR